MPLSYMGISIPDEVPAGDVVHTNTVIAEPRAIDNDSEPVTSQEAFDLLQATYLEESQEQNNFHYRKQGIKSVRIAELQPLRRAWRAKAEAQQESGEGRGDGRDTAEYEAYIASAQKFRKALTRNRNAWKALEADYEARISYLSDVRDALERAEDELERIREANEAREREAAMTEEQRQVKERMAEARQAADARHKSETDALARMSDAELHQYLIECGYTDPAERDALIAEYKAALGR